MAKTIINNGPSKSGERKRPAVPNSPKLRKKPSAADATRAKAKAGGAQASTGRNQRAINPGLRLASDLEDYDEDKS